MFTNSKKSFVPVSEAIGALVLAGFGVRWEVQELSGYGKCGLLRITTAADSETVLNTFRDGSSYAIKVESVQDVLDHLSPPGAYVVTPIYGA
jgi:hypothetical protein